MAIEGIDEATARARLHETDRARARYVDQLYRSDPADTRLYHLVVDSTSLDTDDCVGVLAGAAEAFWRHGTDQTSSPPSPTIQAPTRRPPTHSSRRSSMWSPRRSRRGNRS
jgi:hypothetical protein